MNKWEILVTSNNNKGHVRKTPEMSEQKEHSKLC